MKYIVVILIVLLPIAVRAQGERSAVREGNKFFELGKFAEAEASYKKALQKNVTSYEATFNLGGAQYKSNQFAEAAAAYQKLANEGGASPANKASAFYNLGNSQFQTRKLDEAIEAYKSTLRINPNDVEAKFNLAYAQKLKQEDDKKNDQNKDQNKDQNQDQNKDQNQDQNKDQNKDDKKDNKDNKDKQDQQNQPPPPKPESKQMLDAMQAAEDKTKDKVEKDKTEAVGVRGVKQW